MMRKLLSLFGYNVVYCRYCTGHVFLRIVRKNPWGYYVKYYNSKYYLTVQKTAVSTMYNPLDWEVYSVDKEFKRAMELPDDEGGWKRGRS